MRYVTQSGPPTLTAFDLRQTQAIPSGPAPEMLLRCISYASIHLHTAQSWLLPFPVHHAGRVPMVLSVAPQSPKTMAPPSFALFEMGFRGFYLAGSLWAIAGVGLWTLRLAGVLDDIKLDVGWHIHEMIFGFIAAIISGFALTAVRNWTARPTPTGLPLGLLLMLWVAGRIAMLMAPSFPAAAVDLAFLPVIAVAVLFPILRAGQTRNLFLPAVLLALGSSTLAITRAVLAYGRRRYRQPCAGGLSCRAAGVCDRRQGDSGVHRQRDRSQAAARRRARHRHARGHVHCISFRAR